MKNASYRFTKRSFSLALGLGALAACASAASTDTHRLDEAANAPAPPVGVITTGFNAVAADANVQLFALANPDPQAAAIPFLVSNNHGFLLSCADPTGLTSLIAGAGFPNASSQFLPTTTLTSATVQQLAGKDTPTLADFPTLRCNDNPANFYSVDVNNERKYFLRVGDRDESDPPRTILRNIGCAQLIRAMGFEMRSALSLPYVVATNDYTIDDQYDINCKQGTNPNDFVPRIVASSEFQNAGRGNAIVGIGITLQNGNPGENATVILKDDTCQFLTVNGQAGASGGAAVTGVVPTNFRSKTCSVNAVGVGVDFETLPVKLSFDFGCEIDSVDHCGNCATSCTPPAHSTALCIATPVATGDAGADADASADAGQTGMTFACGSTCSGLFADCNHQTQDGCETATDTLQNCGACGKTCGGTPNTVATCGGGVCKVQCKTGFIDCDGKPENGCEANIGSNSSCGGCGNVCAQGPNSAASCAFDASTNNFKCGLACTSPSARNCDGNAANGCEIANVNSISTCGDCGHFTSCATGPNMATTCNGSCQYQCTVGTDNCDGNLANGCERAIRNDVNNCGACNLHCAQPANTTAHCNGASCSTTCNAGYSDCNGSVAGCETFTSGSDINNCGGCGVKCGHGPNASARCNSGSCGTVCNAGFADCNGNAGCETATTSDPNNCGGCGVQCNDFQQCKSGRCVTLTCPDIDCGAGFICQGHKCVRNPVCNHKPDLPVCTGQGQP